MKRLFIIVLLLCNILILKAQETKERNALYLNGAEKMIKSDSKLSIGGYGEIVFSKPFGGDTRSNAKLDVQRFVMMLGYKFNSKTSFITELEFEHVNEVYVEQAFLQYRLNNSLSLRAGLILTPMGIINEYHEPTTFNGVLRPMVDKYITPTTWREVGVGVLGYLSDLNIKYQAYITNGFKSYDEKANLSGASGLRGGRQKGAKSFMSSPNFATRFEYFGIKGLNVGLSGYLGNTQSKLYDGLDENDDTKLAAADDSVLGISMLGVDARYICGGLQLRGQFYYVTISNSEDYNIAYTKDIGSSMIGYYAEVGYNILKSFKTNKELIPFIRYEKWNTHNTVEGVLIQNEKYNNSLITTGLTLKLAKGAVLKSDIQFKKSEFDSSYSKTFNLGVGVMF